MLLFAALLGLSGPIAAIPNGGYDIGVAGPVAISALIALATVLAFVPGALPSSAPGLLAIGGLTGLALVLALSVAWSPMESVGWLIAVKGIGYAAVFILAAIAVRGAAAAVALLSGLAAGATAVAATSLIQVMAAADPRDEFFDERLAAPVGYQNGLAVLLFAGGVPLVAAAAARVETWPALVRRTGAYLALALVGGVALAALSRGAILGVIAAIVALAALMPARLRLLPPLWALGLSLAVSYGPASDLRNGVGMDAATAAAAADAWGGRTLLLVTLLGAVGLAHALVELRLGRQPEVRQGARWAGIGGLAIIALVAVAVGVVNADRVADRVQDPFRGVAASDVPESGGERLFSVSSNSRVDVWQQALAATSDRPFVGQGAGGWSIWWNQNREEATVDTLFAHSLPLEIASETGVLGLALLALWLAGLAWIAVVLLRRPGASRALTAVLVAVVVAWFASASVDWLWNLPGVTLPAIVAAGAMLGLASPERARGGGTRPTRLVVPGVALVVALAGITFCALPLLADRSLDRAAAIGVDDIEAARDRVDRAEALFPHDPRIDEIRARLSLGAGDLTRARRELVEGTRRTPEHYEPWSRLGDLDLYLLNRPERALTSYRMAAANHNDSSAIEDQIEEALDRLESDAGDG